jgi:opacity protein-like surface antigen
MYCGKVLLICIYLLVTVVSFAHGKSNPEIYLNGGYSIPSRPQIFAEIWSPGYNVGTGVIYSISPSISLVGSIDYNRFRFDEESFLIRYGFGSLGAETSGGNITIFSVSGSVKINLIAETERITPYIIGGIGASRISTSDITVYFAGVTNIRGDSETAFTASTGGGMNIILDSRIKLFVQAAYAICLTNDDNTYYLPLKIGLVFSLW